VVYHIDLCRLGRCLGRFACDSAVGHQADYRYCEARLRIVDHRYDTGRTCREVLSRIGSLDHSMLGFYRRPGRDWFVAGWLDSLPAQALRHSAKEPRIDCWCTLGWADTAAGRTVAEVTNLVALLVVEEDKIADSRLQLVVADSLQYAAMVKCPGLSVDCHMKVYVVGWCSARPERHMVGYQVEERIGQPGCQAAVSLGY
jgi:hypothetical protein